MVKRKKSRKFKLDKWDIVVILLMITSLVGIYYTTKSWSGVINSVSTYVLSGLIAVLVVKKAVNSSSIK